jgi:hypothetical protein
MSNRMAAAAATAIGVVLLAGLVAGEPKAGLLYLAARGSFYDYRCPDGSLGVAYVPIADAR